MGSTAAATSSILFSVDAARTGAHLALVARFALAFHCAEGARSCVERAEPRAAMVFGGGATRGGLERPDASPGGVWSARRDAGRDGYPGEHVSLKAARVDFVRDQQSI